MTLRGPQAPKKRPYVCVNHPHQIGNQKMGLEAIQCKSSRTPDKYPPITVGAILLYLWRQRTLSTHIVLRIAKMTIHIAPTWVVVWEHHMSLLLTNIILIGLGVEFGPSCHSYCPHCSFLQFLGMFPQLASSPQPSRDGGCSYVYEC